MKIRHNRDPGRLLIVNAKWDLEEGRWAYNSGNGKKALYLIRRAMKDIVVSPPLDSEEYQRGEEKEEQTFEEETEENEESARDDDGYLIR